MDNAENIISDSKRPVESMICSEEMKRWSDIMGQLPYEQREVVILHLRAGMRFRQIAKLQGISVNTIKGRYRYGLDKLRTILNGEMEK